MQKFVLSSLSFNIGSLNHLARSYVARNFNQVARNFIMLSNMLTFLSHLFRFIKSLFLNIYYSFDVLASFHKG